MCSIVISNFPLVTYNVTHKKQKRLFVLRTVVNLGVVVQSSVSANPGLTLYILLRVNLRSVLIGFEQPVPDVLGRKHLTCLAYIPSPVPNQLQRVRRHYNAKRTGIITGH